VSTAQDLPLAFAEPALDLAAAPAQPALRLVPSEPLDFDAAVGAVRPRLHRYATRRLGDAHEAEELVQEALLRAYSHRDKFATEEDLSAWSTVVTGRLVIDRLRVRNRCTSVAEVPETGRRGRDTADVVVARDEARTALDALDAMPARQASVLWAREVEGDSYEQLCVRFGMTEPAVRSILSRARKSLRAEYALRGGSLPVGGLAILAPWLAGLTWAQRLRQATGRITAPAALGVVGVTALGTLALAPFSSDQPGQSPTFSTDGVVAAVAVKPVKTVKAPAQATTKSTPSVRRTTVVVPPPAAPKKVVDVTDSLPCSGPVQSAGCVRPEGGARLVLNQKLPANPIVHDTLWVSQSNYDCSGWVSNPLVSCTTERDAR
jgi:RNA polymerase sigma factor (sigma-70 family)